MKINELTFPHIANNLALDFLNTMIIDRGERHELLNSPQDLLNWASEVGLTLSGRINNQHLSDVLEFRKLLREVFLAGLDSGDVPSELISHLNQYLANYSKAQKIEKVDDKLSLQPIHSTLTLQQLIGHIANEAALLLVSKQWVKVKKCANPACVLLFLDVSKSGRRRWCSMEVCGNRAKAANHYSNKR